MTAVDAIGLSCRIAKQPILTDVSFHVDAGQRIGVIGPNGAGKTTLLRCLMGMQPSSGHLRIFDKAARDYSRRELATIMSYVPQPDAAYVPFSVFDFVLMGRYPHLSPFTSVSAEDKDAAREALAMTDAEPFRDRRVHTLSGGERQRVFIAAALAQGARILLLDEPTAFLDYKYQIEIEQLLRRLNRDNGVTIIAVTHDVNAAVLASDAVLALKSGRVAYWGQPDSLLENGVLERVYDASFRVVEDPAGGPPLITPRSARRE